MKKQGRRSVSYQPRRVVARCEVRARVVKLRGRTGVHVARSGVARCEEAGSPVGETSTSAGGCALRSRDADR